MISKGELYKQYTYLWILKFRKAKKGEREITI